MGCWDAGPAPPCANIRKPRPLPPTDFPPPRCWRCWMRTRPRKARPSRRTVQPPRLPSNKAASTGFVAGGIIKIDGPVLAGAGHQQKTEAAHRQAIGNRDAGMTDELGAAQILRSNIQIV